MPKHTCAVVALTLVVSAVSAIPKASAQSQEGLRAVALETVVDSLKARNASLRAYRELPRSIRERGNDITLSDPRVSFSYFPEPIYTARGPQQWSLRGEFDIPFPGKIGLRQDLHDLDATAEELAAEAIEDRLIFEASTAYFELQRIDFQIDLAHDFEQRLRTFEDAATTMYEVGTGSQQDILSAQLERRTLEASLMALRADRVSRIEHLAHLQNGIVIPAATPLESVDFVLDVTSTQSMAVNALERRPDVARIDTMMRSKETEIQLAGKDWLPDLGLHVAYYGIGVDPIPITSDGKDALAVGGTIRLPIFGGNRNRGADAARAEMSRLQFQRAEAEAQIQSRVGDLLSRFRRETEQVVLLEDSILPQARTTVDVALTAYTSGKTRFLELLDLERRLYGLQNRLAESIERQRSALAELEWIAAYDFDATLRPTP